MMILPDAVLERMVQYDLHNDDWLDSRPDFMGASELAGITNNSHWPDSTQFQAWLRKTGQEEDMDPDRQNNLNRGNRAEAAILGEYGDSHTDLYVQSYQKMCVAHPVYPRIRCSPDGLLFLDGQLHAGVDAKFMEVYSRQFFGDPGSDDMPTDYVVQGLISCECLGVPYWDFATWFGRNSYVEYRVVRNTKVAEALIVEALAFYDDYVETRLMPEIDGSEPATRFLSRTYNKVAPIMALPTDMAIGLRDQIVVAEARKKHLEADIAEHKNKLRALCGTSEGIQDVCTWRKNKDTEKTDWKAIVLELAEKVGERVVAPIVGDNTTIREGSRALRIVRKKA